MTNHRLVWWSLGLLAGFGLALILLGANEDS